jgi:HSP20 family protein
MMTNVVTKPPATAPTRPFRAFGDLDRILSRMTHGWPFSWSPEPASGEPRTLRAFEHVPNVEVKENGEHYTLSIELPGLDEKDVKVTVEDDVLGITGEKRIEHTDEKTHYSERSYGSFTRSFSLPADADRNAITATFAKGVLSLKIAKAANPAPRGKQIEIKQA